jgi:hypothetical protein
LRWTTSTLTKKMMMITFNVFASGTNDDAIIHVVSTRCNAQRQTLKKKFKVDYGRVSI